MCEFCENYSEHKAFYVPIRNTYADDNVCEMIKGDSYSCEDCVGCTDENYHFTLYKYENGIGLGFIRVIGDMTISPTSERIFVNYCPFCGERLNNEELETFDKCCVSKLKRIER